VVQAHLVVLGQVEQDLNLTQHREHLVEMAVQVAH
jgi:hypothetical protein